LEEKKIKMDRISKRKSVQKNYAFTIGERCIKWEGYPYNSSIRTIVKQTKVYWILDDGCKYKKSDLNYKGFVGYSDFFIEPITRESLSFVCCKDMRQRIEEVVSIHSDDFNRMLAIYDAAIPYTGVDPFSLYIMKRYLETGSFDYLDKETNKEEP
jgi:hypothetical protein